MMWAWRGAVLAAALLVATSAAFAASPAPHHAVQINASPDNRSVHVTDTIEIYGERVLDLRLADLLAVRSVRVDGRPLDGVRPEVGGQSFSLKLSGEQQHSIEISGDVRIPADGGFGVISMFAAPDWLYLPSTAWLSEIGEASYSYRLTVEVPPPYRAVATGTLESEELTATANRATFVAENATTPPWVFAGRYAVNERMSSGGRLRTYFTANAAANSDGYLQAADRYIQRFSEEIGPHLFSGFSIVAAPKPVGLGFPGLTYIDQRILPLPFVRERSLGHEVLHDWWGNGVIPDYERGNWSEGLTTYMADHAFAADRDPKDAREIRFGWLRDFAPLPSAKDTPIVRFVSRTHDASQIIGYGKTAYVFHMLKSEVGEERFRNAIRRFWQEYKGRVAGWPDIRRVFEAEAGTDLGWFFGQWLIRTGAPTLALGDAKVTPQGGGYQVEIVLRQDAVAPWRFTVPVDIVTETGVEHLRIPVALAETNYTATVTARPLAVRVDPEYTLFRRLLPGEALPILRDVLLDADARAMVAGADPAMVDAAREVAGRLFEAKQPVWVQNPSDTEGALVIFGTPDEITRLLALPDMPPRPAVLPTQGTARVWTAMRANGKPLLVIEAADAQALSALAAPLPHYRNKSYLVFDGRHAVTQGVWPPNTAVMEKRF